MLKALGYVTVSLGLMIAGVYFIKNGSMWLGIASFTLGCRLDIILAQARKELKCG